MWEVKRRTDAHFKWVMWQCKCHDEQIRADRAAAALLRSGKEFWKEINRQSTAKVPRAATVGDALSEQEIADLFMSRYNSVFNSVRDADEDIDYINSIFGRMSNLHGLLITPRIVGELLCNPSPWVRPPMRMAFAQSIQFTRVAGCTLCLAFYLMPWLCMVLCRTR